MRESHSAQPIMGWCRTLQLGGINFGRLVFENDLCFGIEVQGIRFALIIW